MESHLPATIASAISGALRENWQVEPKAWSFVEQSEHKKEPALHALQSKLIKETRLGRGDRAQGQVARGEK